MKRKNTLLKPEHHGLLKVIAAQNGVKLCQLVDAVIEAGLQSHDWSKYVERKESIERPR